MSTPGRPGTAEDRHADRSPEASGEHGGDLLDVVIGHGTLLAGRYRLSQPITTDLPGVECWSAQDQILDRPVRALVIRSDRAQQAQDAARRAALVSDPRLLRVLDVGDHEGVAYTVTEATAGRSLAELTVHGPLPADQARSIVGEAAAALEIARRRGVHHLALRPSVVHVTPEGGVLVSGLAIDGELSGHGLGDARSTTRADTVGLVALLYAAVTGHWPAPDHVDPGDARLAPVVAGSPVPPAELSPGVPNDLDTLCAVTLGPHDDGPHSPAELVRELEPWGPIAAAEIFGALDAAAAWRRPSPGPTPPAPTLATELPQTDDDEAVADGDEPVADGDEDEGSPGAAAGPGSATTDDPDAGTSEEPDPGAAEPRSVQRQSARSLDTGRAVRPGTPPPAIPPERQRTDPRLAVPAVTRPGAPVITSPVGDPDAHPTTTFQAERSAGLGTPPPARPTTPVDRSHLEPEGFEALIGGATNALVKKRFDPTPVVLGLILITVLFGLGLAWSSLTRPAPPIGGSDGFGDVQDVQAEQPDPAGEGDGEPAPEEPVEPTPTPTPEPVPPVIASAQQLDPPPDGDNNEHPEAVDRAIDGDPSTYWFSRTYVSASYGMKDGIGYAVTLVSPATVSTVMLDVDGSGGMVEIRATDPSTPTEGEVLASGEVGPDTVFELSEPTETEHVVLWFTELPQTPDGSNRIELREIQVS